MEDQEFFFIFSDDPDYEYSPEECSCEELCDQCDKENQAAILIGKRFLNELELTRQMERIVNEVLDEVYSD